MHGVIEEVKRTEADSTRIARPISSRFLVHMVASHAGLDSELLHLEVQLSFTNFSISMSVT